MKVRGGFNKHLPFTTLLKVEIGRFFKFKFQALFGPIISSALFIFVFGLHLGSRVSIDESISYIDFIVPGLILLGVTNSSFSNASFSLFFPRHNGTIVDLLVLPLTPNQLVLAFTFASMLRGMLVGISIYAISLFFTNSPWHDPISGMFIVLLSSFLFSQFGILAAIYSESFETLSLYTNFIIMPLIYFGGLFYPISILPDMWKSISQVNPLFYMIDGFRNSAIGFGDNRMHTNFLVLIIISLILYIWTNIIIKIGYKLKT